MSLILEALKKSEAKRQLGEAPGLGTPFTVARRRRSPLPVIVLLILVAAGFGWYYLRPTSAPTPASEAGASKSSAAPTTVVADSSPRAATAAPANATRAINRLNPAAPQAPAGGQQASTPPTNEQSAGQPIAPGARADPRMRGGAVNQLGAAPPEGSTDAAAARMAQRFGRPLSGPANAAPNPVPGDTGFPRAPNATAPAAATTQQPVPLPPPRAPMAQTPVQVAATTTPAPAVAAPQTVAAPPSVSGGAQQPAPAPTPVTATAKAAPDLPMYYELPFNVRKDLPALVVSMHVYAAVPEQRFVVIDGERRSEGEVVKEGLTLREIRSDGIVLDLRGQRFFYPRSGR